MPKKNKSSQGQTITITGNTSGQIAVGNNNKQSQTTVHNKINPGEVKELRRAIDELRAKVEALSDPGVKDSALEQVDQLEQAVTAKKPNVSKMERVKNWFGKNVPALAGAVTSVVVHPIVGKLVEAGGDMLVKEFQEKFGGGS